MPDFKIRVGGRLRKIDIAIFNASMGHTVENLRRVVMCEKEPTKGTKGAYKMRDHEQAKKEFDPLYSVMTEAKDCRYGLWTNGLAIFGRQVLHD
jgi:type I restriction enzyme M protein